MIYTKRNENRKEKKTIKMDHPSGDPQINNQQTNKKNYSKKNVYQSRDIFLRTI